MIVYYTTIRQSVSMENEQKICTIIHGERGLKLGNYLYRWKMFGAYMHKTMNKYAKS